MSYYVIYDVIICLAAIMFLGERPPDKKLGMDRVKIAAIVW